MAYKTPWPICNSCSAIPSTVFYPTQCSGKDEAARAYLLHSFFRSLQNSALRGCHVCSLFYEAVREPFKSQLSTAPVYLESHCTVEGTQQVSLTANLHETIRVEGGDETSVADGMNDLSLQTFKYPPIAEVNWATSPEDIPATARNYKGTSCLPSSP
jgi:hypothetical protein